MSVAATATGLTATSATHTATGTEKGTDGTNNVKVVITVTPTGISTSLSN